MDKPHIQTIGHFLSTYDSDLFYIRRFLDFKKGSLNASEYVKKERGSFYKFLIEFKVIRNIPKNKSLDLIQKTNDWLKSNDNNDVDTFANYLKDIKLTPKLSKSMASKILFLNNPKEIIPMDSRTRKTLGLKENDYKKYLNKLNTYELKHSKVLEMLLKKTNPFLLIVNKSYPDIKGLDLVAKNRMLDKLLWTLG